ncbi:MAG: hypothetical protein Q9160_001931 [Pyrenula sp. 1 TL-2023]
MGIAGLLPLLKSIHKPCNLKKFQGQTIGVDAYGWLHRGTVSCATELALGQNSTKYVDFAMHRVRMLIYFGVKPYLVFDGANLPSKAATETERADRRRESKQRGLNLYHAGRASQAHQELQKAVDVTPEMARRLIEELKKMDIQYVVAPYEADAQLAYLERKGIINGILSEDSDLLVFGAKRLLTKLDQHGDCVEINRADFTACRDISLIGWTDTDFRCMAILSGCDYLPSINKMGLKTAYRYVRKHKNVEKVLRMMSFDGQFCVPVGYLDKFRRAELTFLHHRVFCPVTQSLVMLTELGRDKQEEDLPFLGEDIDAETAIGVACGELHPTTKEPMTISPRRSVARGRHFEPRRVTLGSTADVKGNCRPIDAWLKPRRIPLAELDPNSLCYSPSTLRAMDANGDLSLEPETTTSVRHMRRSTSDLPAINSASSSAGSAERTSFLTRAATMSTYRSPKRQRLCAESCEQSPSAMRKSPFFSPKLLTKPSHPKKRSRKSTDTEFGIYSDDSIEEVLADLPDIEQAKPPKLRIFVEHSPQSDAAKDTSSTCIGKAPTPDEVLIPQSSPVQSDPPKEEDFKTEGDEVLCRSLSDQTTAIASQSTDRTCISAETEPEIFEDMVGATTNVINQRLRDRFSYCTPIAKAQADMTTKEVEMVKIGQAAIQDKLAQSFSVSDPVKAVQEQAEDPVPASSTLTREEASIRSPTIHEKRSAPVTEGADNTLTMNQTVPSEDLIIPSSDDDGEDLCKNGDADKARTFDIKRFTFHPT